MTRRIAICILLTVWAILIAVGISAYLMARVMLVADLDQTIVMRAASLPQLLDEHGNAFQNSNPVGSSDRFLVRNDLGQTLVRPPEGQAGSVAPQILDAAFTTIDGVRYRRVTLRAFVRPKNSPDGALEAVTVVFSGLTDHYEMLMRRLAWTLVICGVAGGALAAGAAVFAARASLRPLRETAQAIASIDERALDQRLDAARLPPELRPVADRVNDLLGRVEQALTRRKRFLADASHELRTPVAAMLTAVEVALRRPRDAEAYRQTLETCLHDVRLLRQLVESLMTQARSEVPALNEEPQTFELHAVVEEVLASLSPLAEQKSVHFVRDVPEDIQLHLAPMRLRSVLMNLIANAIEHNPPGGQVTVAATTQRNGPAGVRRVHLAVTDNGPGIDAKHLPHLFEPFYRADSARESDRGNTAHLGLGLFLVKTHVMGMGGECTVRSTVGGGTTLELALPLSQATTVVRSTDSAQLSHLHAHART